MDLGIFWLRDNNGIRGGGSASPQRWVDRRGWPWPETWAKGQVKQEEDHCHESERRSCRGRRETRMGPGKRLTPGGCGQEHPYLWGGGC